MRTGVDLRRPRKPAAFVELVDTRWDEFNRIAEINTLQVSAAAPSQAAPAAFPPVAGPRLMEGTPLPPAPDPRNEPESSRAYQPGPIGPPPETRFPGNPNGENPSGAEPSRMPGGADVPVQSPLPRNAPLSRRSSVDDSQTAATATGTVTTDSTSAASQWQAADSRSSRRPMASRLFSRPQ